jgi:endoglucanase
VAGYYYFINVSSGLVLDVEGGSEDDGASVIQYSAHPDEDPDNQLWSYVSDGPEFTTIVNKGSGQVLDVDGSSTEAGAPIIQFPSHESESADNQLWTLQRVELAADHEAQYLVAFRVVNKNSGYVLDVEGADVEAGASVVQYPAHPKDEAANQLWYINTEPVTPAPIAITN